MSEGSTTVRRPSPRMLASTCATLGGLLALVCWFAVHTRTGQALDSWGLGMLAAQHERLALVVARLRAGLLVGACLAALIACLVVARRRQPRDLAFGVLTLGVCAVGAEVLKAVLPRPDLGSYAYPYNTLPSGHVAITVGALVVTVVLQPSRRHERALVVTAGALAVVACWASVATFAHRPADVLAAVLLVGAVSAGFAAALHPSALRLQVASPAAAATGHSGTPTATGPAPSPRPAGRGARRDRSTSS